MPPKHKGRARREAHNLRVGGLNLLGDTSSFLKICGHIFSDSHVFFSGKGRSPTEIRNSSVVGFDCWIIQTKHLWLEKICPQNFFRLGRRQAVRQEILNLPFGCSNHPAPASSYFKKIKSPFLSCAGL